MNYKSPQATLRASKAAPVMPARIVALLANAPHAHLVIRSDQDRVAVLPEIVSLHTKSELLDIQGLGPIAIKKVQIWLAYYERRLRRPDESLDTVICRLSFRAARSREFFVLAVTRSSIS